jgi:hypothetical protein
MRIGLIGEDRRGMWCPFARPGLLGDRVRRRHRQREPDDLAGRRVIVDTPPVGKPIDDPQAAATRVIGAGSPDRGCAAAVVSDLNADLLRCPAERELEARVYVTDGIGGEL